MQLFDCPPWDDQLSFLLSFGMEQTNNKYN